METERAGDPGKADVADNPFPPFALAAAILETTRKCLMDRDAGNGLKALVIPRKDSGNARHIWKAIGGEGSEVSIEDEPDQGSTQWNVLLFTRKEQTS